MIDVVVDVGLARNRRRFYLDRALRKRSLGSGSDLHRLMSLPRSTVRLKPEDLFGDIPAVVVGGVATRAYAPERHTKDVDFLLDHERFSEADDKLRRAGFLKDRDLLFPNASLGLYGQAWRRGDELVDILATPQEWGAQALKGQTLDPTGVRVVPLPYLVLMKFDSARGVDQGDLTRILGRLKDAEVEQLIGEVASYSCDPSFADDVWQYVQLGRWEWTDPDSGPASARR
jgi:hypothetical protein